MFEKFYTNRKSIIFITDSDTEKIPFEIIGKNKMLEETHSIYYLTSIISAIKKYNNPENTVSLIYNNNNEIFQKLEKIALYESGIAYNPEKIVTSGIGHIQSTLMFNPVKSGFYINNAKYENAIKSPALIYLPSVTFLDHRSYNDFAMINSISGIKTLILNDAGIHDINNAIFVETFYKEIMNGNNYLQAFDKAKSTIRKNEKYNHPAYWAGIRLYINGF